MQISRLLQIVLLLTFFLPFFPEGCSDEGTNAEIEKMRADSIARADSITLVDSVLKIHPNINIDSFLTVQNRLLAKPDSINNVNKVFHDSATTQTDSIADKDDSVHFKTSENLSKKSKLLKTILRPHNNYTGIGFIVDTFEEYIIFFGALTAFLFFILGLIIKYKDFNNSFNWINIIAWILLLFTNPIINWNVSIINWDFWSDKLWGYWVCLVFGIIMIIYDSMTLIKIKHKKPVHNTL
jgi:hypothetical protein